MSVVTDRTSFVIPPQRALWLPVGTMHEVSTRGPVSLRTVYIDPAYDSEPSRCRVLEVSNLLRALILEVTGFDYRKEMDARERSIVRLFLDEVPRMPNAPYHV